MENKQLNDVLNAGIGAIKTSREVWDKLVVDLSHKKTDIKSTFEKLKVDGEKDFSEGAVNVKVGVAWGIIRFEELRDNVIRYFNKKAS